MKQFILSILLLLFFASSLYAQHTGILSGGYYKPIMTSELDKELTSMRLNEIGGSLFLGVNYRYEFQKLVEFLEIGYYVQNGHFTSSGGSISDSLYKEVSIDMAIHQITIDYQIPLHDRFSRGFVITVGTGIGVLDLNYEKVISYPFYDYGDKSSPKNRNASSYISRLHNLIPSFQIYSGLRYDIAPFFAVGGEVAFNYANSSKGSMKQGDLKIVKSPEINMSGIAIRLGPRLMLNF